MVPRPIAALTLTIGAYVAISAVAVMLMPRPHTRLEYLVAGALATVVCLIVAFVLYLRSKPSRAS